MLQYILPEMRKNEQKKFEWDKNKKNHVLNVGLLITKPIVFMQSL